MTKNSIQPKATVLDLFNNYYFYIVIYNLHID